MKFPILISILFHLLMFLHSVHAQSGVVLTDVEFAEKFSTQDTFFSRPFIDMDEIRSTPIAHRYVHGGFMGTQTRFSFYFPMKEDYTGRFFQYITPFPDNENLSQGAKGEEDKISFSISNGAYFVETNGGGAIDFANPRANDPTIGAYRANAASASFSRVVAQEILGGGRPYGYAFGGSGGAYRTIGGAENTEGVWDGVVPYVLGSPMAIPSVFTVRMHAMRMLKDKFPEIIDAVEPGGSGDMYAGLNDDEKAALEEVTKMGFPPESWFGYETMGIHGFLVLYQGVVMADNAYFTEDFWNKPGYLGHDDPQSFVGSRIQQNSRIKRSIGLDEAIDLGLVEPLSPEDRGSADLAWKSMGGQAGERPVAYELEDKLPEVDFLGGDLNINSGDGSGSVLQIAEIHNNTAVLAPTNSPSVLVKIQAGDEVVVDNSNFLAVQTYHRHQVPGPEYEVWDQFRDEEGNPLYPQRPMLLGPLFTQSASGTVPTGEYHGKMILLGSLLDREAFPWQCDWYRNQVKEHLGEDTDANFRLWYTENALHGDQSSQLGDPTRAISYLGVLQQALLDISDWVERDIQPALSTQYEIEDGQVIIASSANARKGIQPVPHLTIDGDDRANISQGESIEFDLEIAVPENFGKIVSVEWDFEGAGTFQVHSDLEINEKLNVKATHTFNQSGTYFPTVRVVSQRHGDDQTPFARIQNLDRVRVVVN